MLQCSLCKKLTKEKQIIPCRDNGEVLDLFILPCFTCGERIRKEFAEGKNDWAKETNLKLYSSLELDSVCSLN